MNIDKITRLLELRSRINLLRKEEMLVKRPEIHEYSMIKPLYADFSALNYGGDGVWRRKKFLYCVMYLIAPQVLCGDKMPRGLRVCLSEALGVNGSVISSNSSNLAFLHKKYRDFREDTDNFIMRSRDKYLDGRDGSPTRPWQPP